MISRDGLKEALDRAGVSLTNAELDAFFDDLDRDGSGSIDVTEFRDAFFGTNERGSAQRAKKALAEQQQRESSDHIDDVIDRQKKEEQRKGEERERTREQRMKEVAGEVVEELRDIMEDHEMTLLDAFHSFDKSEKGAYDPISPSCGAVVVVGSFLFDKLQ